MGCAAHAYAHGRAWPSLAEPRRRPQKRGQIYEKGICCIRVSICPSVWATAAEMRVLQGQRDACVRDQLCLARVASKSHTGDLDPVNISFQLIDVSAELWSTDGRSPASGLRPATTSCRKRNPACQGSAEACGVSHGHVCADTSAQAVPDAFRYVATRCKPACDMARYSSSATAERHCPQLATA